ncbi:MAG: GNAT family N-acetyltransferase [Verrucomicrobia bacterium]|nr:GNAT family N-acetyltransferase [Verrucomicrobiota bacterium]
MPELEAEWTALWQRCPHATPFQHPTWLNTWWRHFGDNKRLLMVTLRESGVLVGVAPLCILRDSEGRKVMFLGAGLSDFMDGLFAPGHEQAGAQAVLAYLAEAASLWDLCDLRPLPSKSALLRGEAPEGFTSEVMPVDTLTALDLPPGVAAFRQRLSRHFADRVKEADRRAKKLGALRFETAGPKTLDQTLDALLRFHDARWQNAATVGNPTGLFHRETASAMLARGALRLYSLHVCEQIVAVLYGFVHQERGYFYLMGFDPEFRKISPGMLLMTHAIEELIRERVTQCDFLRGRETFKYRWGVSERTTYARRLHRRL